MDNIVDQLQEVERRLAEAHATIDALLSGQIDAVVDPNTGTPVLLANAREALRASEERTTYALRAAGIGIWELDVHSGEATWSETMPALFGLPPEATPTNAKGFLALVHPEDRDVTEAAFRAALLNGKDFTAEFRTTWPDGAVHWIASEAHFRAGREGHPASMLGSTRTSAIESCWNCSSVRRRRWKRSATWPAASRTTSTTC